MVNTSRTTDFNTFCAQWEERVFIQILLNWRLASQEQIQNALQEKSSPLSPVNTTLGQILVRNRVLSPVNFSKANNLVRQQLQNLYTKQQGDAATLNVSQTAHVASREAQQPSRSQVNTPQPQQTRRFGSYELIEEIARGGMGVVYKARQMYLNRIVALKLLLSGTAASESEILRFKREAEAAGSLQHPNIVSIYEIGKQDNHHYFTMDFVDGETLQALIKKKKPRKKLLEYLVKIALALEHAHQKKVIHRDIKPSNIIVSKDGEPKVTDFGLAKKLDAETVLTESGSALGTPFYMSPEQTTGEEEISGKSDIYSLGVILYEILTGRYPFNGSTLIELYHKIVNDDPIPPRKINRKADKDLEIICLKCMEKVPEMRYASAKDLAEDLDNYLKGEAISARRSSLVYRLGRKIKKNKKTIGAVVWGIVTFSALIWLLFFGAVDLELYNVPKNERPQYLKARKHMEEGRLFIRKHKLEEAIKSFEKAIEDYAKMKEAYISIGDIYQVYKDYQKALQEYSRVLKIDKKYAPAYFRKGHSYMGLKDWALAIKEFDKAIEYKPDFTEAFDGRSQAYRYLGDKNQNSADFEKSIKDYERARELEKK
ncbi:protein kinase [Candidatus Uabimicrobium sp. HlEnr_7]|uniref:protein kinase domain-containing protein n=1 Tax=Candidatus Uabimicrobium helgolandensis TaxID=3095367 RepID=UPI0035592F5F